VENLSYAVIVRGASLAGGIFSRPRPGPYRGGSPLRSLRLKKSVYDRRSAPEAIFKKFSGAAGWAASQNKKFQWSSLSTACGTGPLLARCRLAASFSCWRCRHSMQEASASAMSCARQVRRRASATALACQQPPMAHALPRYPLSATHTQLQLATSHLLQREA